MINLTINEKGRNNNIQRAREQNIIIPTIAQMKDPQKDEYLLPIIVDGLLKVGKPVSVIPTNDTWFGVT